jgi:hypothetical protein|tara:strand:+ start:5486 stop:5620 length:135 start_codon:yes stop_codon:yes gene_type:complete
MNKNQKWVADNPFTVAMIMGWLGFTLPLMIAFPVYMVLTMAELL